MIIISFFTLFSLSVFANHENKIDDKGYWKTQESTLENFEINNSVLPMIGPTKEKFFTLRTESTQTKRLWIKGMSVKVLDSKQNILPLNFLCHAQLSPVTSSYDNLLTISEGMESFEFPPGFGIPVLPTANLRFVAQAQNDSEEGITLNYQLKILYVEDQGDSEPLTPLTQIMLSSYGPKFKFKNGSICDDGEFSSNIAKSQSLHFIVKPGLHTYVGEIKKGTFKENQRIHFIKMHLHRFGESVALLDKTTNKLIWKGKASYHIKTKQIDHVDFYSDQIGIPVYPDHEYQVIGQYNNWTNQNAEGMSMLRVYVNTHLIN